MKKFLFAIVPFFLLLSASCTPYDSNKVNIELLQGNWLLVETSEGFTEVEQGRDTTLITFENNLFSEHMPDIDHSESFDFTVSNYNLNLYLKDQHINKLEIAKLTQDSLILKIGKNSRKYVKLD